MLMGTPSGVGPVFAGDTLVAELLREDDGAVISSGRWQASRAPPPATVVVHPHTEGRAQQ